MFGRIQSIFLLAAALMAVLMFFFPAAIIVAPMGEAYVYYVSKTIQADNFIAWNYAPMVLAIIVGLLSFVTIFVNVRKSKSIRPTLLLQFRLCTLNIILQLGLIGMILFQVITIAKEMKIEWNVSTSFIFPVVALIFVVLSIRGIMKDIATLNTYDRIR